MSKIKVDLTDKDSYCPCCQMPYPGIEHKYPLCSPNVELGQMGPGYPLYFEFIKSVGQLMMVLTVVYFAPSAYMMYDAWNGIKDQIDSNEQLIGLFSFGAYITTPDGVDYEFKEFEKRK